MFRFFLSVILLFFLNNVSVLALTINAGISYTTESARIEAFDKTKSVIDMCRYKEYFFDKHHDENLKNFNKGKFNFKNRYISLFGNFNYAVTYKSNESIAYYYNPKGKLEFVEFSSLNTYPRKSIMYDINGKLDSISLSVSPNEQFVFDINKNLVAHWIGNNCYNEKGELIDTRK